MKKTKYLVWMLAAGLMAGCSDDLENGGRTGGTLDGETGYVKVAINLPTTSGMSTRASADGTNGNDVFDDGLANEYAVNNVALLIFQGTDEANATFTGGYDLNMSFNVESPNNDNITSRDEIVAEITKPTAPGNTYALAIINRPTTEGNEIITFSGSTLTVSGETVTNLAGLQKKISNISSLDNFIGSSKNSFLMTNAPIATVPVSAATVPDQTVSTLVPLTVYESEELANLGESDEIYVERIVAKVTVSEDNFTTEGTGENTKYYQVIDNDGAYKNDRAYFDSWYLNITNRSTKLVRDVTGYTDWRSYENATGAQTVYNRFFGLAAPYRVYWAVDGNYDNWDATQTSEFNSYTAENHPTDIDMTALGDNAPAYCLENTFNTDHMQQQETTGIVFAMTYRFDPDRETATTFYMIGDAETVYGSTTDLITAVNTLLGTGNTIEGLTVNEEARGGYYDTQAEMGELFSKESGALTPAETAKLFSALKEVKVYEDGRTYYYAARIKHFGDYYTPLPAGTVDVGDVSEYDDQKHLGRYGVVRNNWYEIIIGSISGPGSPEEPEPGPDPDDKEYAWINARINVLSWAKRVQNVDL